MSIQVDAMKLKGSSLIAGVVVGAAILLMAVYATYSFTSMTAQLYKISIESQAKPAGSRVLLRITNASLNVTSMTLKIVVLNDGSEPLPLISLLELVVSVNINGHPYTYVLKRASELSSGCWVPNAIIVNDVEVTCDSDVRPLRPGESLLIAAQLPLSPGTDIIRGFVAIIALNSKAEKVLSIVK